MAEKLPDFSSEAEPDFSELAEPESSLPDFSTQAEPDFSDQAEPAEETPASAPKSPAKKRGMLDAATRDKEIEQRYGMKPDGTFVSDPAERDFKRKLDKTLVKTNSPDRA